MTNIIYSDENDTSKKPYTPYTYLIGWKSLDRWYYGVRYAQGCHPDDFWTQYFTSSNHVKKFREDHGEPDVIQVRKSFPTGKSARDWEDTVICRIGAVESDRWLNKKRPHEEFRCKGHSEEARAKMRVASKNRSPEYRVKISAAHKGKKRKPFTESHKANISAAQKGRKMTEEQRLAMIASVTGLKRSDETKKKMSENTRDTIVALNIETGVTTRIPLDLFYSRKDIYFSHRSKVYKDWKSQNLQPTTLG